MTANIEPRAPSGATLTTSRRFALLAAVAAMVFAMVPAAPAHADAVAATVAGTAHLSGGFNNSPRSDSGCFSGTATGTRNGAASAEFIYTNTLLIGTASGTLTVLGHSVAFTWSRVGDRAVITMSGSGHSGNGVAQFVPVGPPSLSSPPCGPGSPAQVVGTGVLS